MLKYLFTISESVAIALANAMVLQHIMLPSGVANKISPTTHCLQLQRFLFIKPMQEPVVLCVGTRSFPFEETC